MVEDINTEKGSWSIRGVSPDIRQAVSTQAKKAGIPVGQYIEQAIREKIKSDRNGARSLTIVGKAPVCMQDANEFVGMIATLAGAGVEIPVSLSKNAVALLNRVGRDVKRGGREKPVNQD
ncbi:hypothetical protein [Acetobacter sp.]|uniref:hypothetical protein n=1 Tax=Acetobacter sp. TaxID=440 RepID=UPI0025BADAA8|nr:hypothetical protein [Acetobacter sp.]MCH4092154.1 type II toxin-antitoxin system HicB family antitoxin [Acetobacter sp.]MCI1299929.1 type II toxin-antitoxin system HicB family antitoxin [Acetobacter sp.]MCI1315947.1 type II toxin-antitoxin system HicB family antitoxin [Acetobacter sp.]